MATAVDSEALAPSEDTSRTPRLVPPREGPDMGETEKDSASGPMAARAAKARGSKAPSWSV